MLSLTSTLHAEPRRYAVLIGVDEGDADEVSLLYAEKDDRTTRRSWGTGRPGGLGGAHCAQDTHRSGDQPDITPRTGQPGGLGGPDNQDASEALTALKTRIAADRAEQPDREVLVFVYDSGHASSPKLHLRGSHLPFKALTAQVK